MSLPVGGGAIRGINEKLSVNPATGSSSLTITLPLTPGRGQIAPQLALSYDSGRGNSVFGVGWSIDVPAVSRRTDKGLPRYLDTIDPAAENDTFVLSGAEDLVPELEQTIHGWQQKHRRDGDYSVSSYRPRTEGLYARIERYRHTLTGDVHWRTVSRDNVTSFFGETPAARITDPNDSRRTFQWLLEKVVDDLGNVVAYEYKPEDTVGVDVHAPWETDRLRLAPPANRYLKHLRYANDTPGGNDFQIDVVFDYGDHDQVTPTPEEHPWPARPDSFSSGRSGFDIRTYRLCRRVLVFHAFPELGAQPTLVRSTDFAYHEDPALTYLVGITNKGYLAVGGVYRTKAMPTLEFGYTERRLAPEPQPLTSPPGTPPPRPDHPGARWTDLESEGIGGILSEEAEGWFYRANAGNGQLASPLSESELPNTRLGRGAQLADVAGEGRLDLVAYGGSARGFWRRVQDDGWETFTPFQSLPAGRLTDPNVRFTDLTGDGRPDVLVLEADQLTWYPSLGADGFGEASTIVQHADERASPRLLFADGTASVYLADMTGDGLSDLVRIRNGEIEYWQNLGYGVFGARISMGIDGLFDRVDRFDQRRVRLADVDGSGTTDIVYLGHEGATVWFNQAGNSLLGPQTHPALVGIAEPSAVQVADVLGTGTASLVLPPQPGDDSQPGRFVDLLGGMKPHLLCLIKNNLGLETAISHAPSTRFYLADKAAGRPWITRPPSVIQVVDQVETRDRVAGTKTVTTYRYRHGYYDGVEREFRGFGFVEQRDAVSLDAHNGAGLFTDPPTILDGRLYTPASITRTWFHTGTYLSSDVVSSHMADEYWPGTNGPLLADPGLPAGLTTDEERECVRALRGRPLREEIYGDDGSAVADTPYVVTEHAYQFQVLQTTHGLPHAVVAAHPAQTVTFHSERHADDPRVSQELTLEVDDWGNVTRTATVAYPRRVPADPEQGRMFVRMRERDVVNDVGEPPRHRIGIPIENRDYEVTGIAPAGELFTLSELDAGLAGTAAIAYEEAPNGTPQRRLLARELVTYYTDDLAAELPRAQVGVRALPYRHYALAMTPRFVADVFGGRVTDAMLTGDAGYVGRDGAWWRPSGRTVHDPAWFYEQRAWHDPFGQQWTLAHDAHHLTVTVVSDPLVNTTRTRLNYRVLQPYWLTDANGNESGVRFDELGMVVATALMGKPGAGEGDHLENTPEASPFDDPTTRLEYDLDTWTAAQQPAHVHSFVRERHGAANPRWQESFSYSDGSGHEALKKIQGEPGEAPVRGPDGTLRHNADGSLTLVDTSPQPRWIGTGRVVYDNKGNEVKRYEPYVAADSGFDGEAELVETGVTPLFIHDALGRLVETEHPNGTVSRVEFDAWQQATWDENDTILASRWYADRIGLPAADPQGRAARVTAPHAATPGRADLDPLSRSHRVIADNGALGQYATQYERDIDGNLLRVTDPRSVVALEQRFDMLKQPVHLRSADAGESWTLTDASGQPVRAWDSRGHAIRRGYDELRRLTHIYVSQGGPERVSERRVYGEAAANPEQTNLRTRLHLTCDGAGLVRHDGYDFHGNTTTSVRRLAQQFRVQPNWLPIEGSASAAAVLAAAEPLLEREEFRTETAYDALNRVTLLTSADGSVTRPTYNEANLLETVHVTAGGAGAETAYVEDLDYNARGQRTLIRYRSGVVTTYTYDPTTFRLTAEETRASSGDLLQELRYVHDPVGNVLAIDDGAQQTLFFANTVVSPARLFSYEPVYRLASATGREHIGQTTVSQPGPADPLRYSIPHVNDAAAMRPYTESYTYDEAGNLLSTVHSAGTGSWTRRYALDANTNRLTATSQPTDAVAGPFSATYDYDAHGNCSAMPHLARLDWDEEDRLVFADLGGGGAAYYQYDAGGQRVRAVVQRNDGTRDERLYIDSAEWYRHVVAGDLRDERRTLHVLDGHKRIALLETTTVEGGIRAAAAQPAGRYQLADHLGSAVVEVDQAGLVISYEEYHPFGTTSFHAARSVAQTSLKRYRFTGKEKDAETGLYYHGARYYAPWLGRWISPDPSGITDAVNPYIYVRNNPLALSDPTGLWGWREVAVVAAVVVVGTVVTVATAGAAGPIIAGAVASVGLTGGAATVATGVAVGAVAGAVGGAAAGAAGEGTRQAVHGEHVNVGRIASAAGHGAVEGAAIGAAVGGAAAFAATTTGAAVVAGAGRVGQRIVPAAVRQGAGAVARGVGAGARTAVRAPGIRQVASVARAAQGGVEAVGAASERAGLSVARATFGEGSRGALAAEASVARSTAAAPRAASPGGAGPPRGAGGGPGVGSPDVTPARGVRAAQAAARGEEETVSVYHGSIHDASRIRASGLDPERLPSNVTRDLRAAQDAIGPNRYEVSQGMARDPGIIESRIPRSDFERHLLPNERRYTGFHGANLDSSEIVLRERPQVELFNRHIVR